MSTVFEPAIGGGLAPKNGNSNGTAVSRGREIRPLGINAQKVVAKRYSLNAKTDCALTGRSTRTPRG